MNKCLLMISFAAATFTAVALEFLPQPNSQIGKIVFVNRQDRLPVAEIASVCEQIEKAIKCKAIIGKPGAGQVEIEIINDDKSPILSAFPEDYSAKVNIGRLDKNLKGKALGKFFASRCRKELLRAFCYACGAGGSQYPDNIMSIADITGLDLVEEFIPGDTAFACVARLAKVGVKPTRFATYAKACREGWAPPPTNDVQKAIWEKIHQIPDKPITIEFDPKKDK